MRESLIKYVKIMVRVIDFQELRQRLPRGAITAIADKIGVDPRVVSEVFNNGWHKQYHSKVLAYSIAILKEENLEPELLEDAEAMKLMTTDLYALPVKKKKRKVEVDEEPETWKVLLSVVGVGVVVLMGYNAYKKWREANSDITPTPGTPGMPGI